MRAIVNTGSGRLEMLELPLPEPRPGQVLIRTGACGICATDLVMIQGWQRTPFGAIPGHEWAGTIDAVGPGVEGGLVGRRCVADNVWSAGGEVGFEHPGGYAEYFVTEAANVRTLPSAFDLVTATLVEPLAVCVRGLARLGAARPPLVIFGDGPIGLLTVILLSARRISGVVVAGGRDRRLALAREFGAHAATNYHAAGGDLPAAVRRTCGASSFRCLIEASGSADALEACIALAAPDASVLVLGDYGTGRAHFEWNTLLHKELRIVGSNASAGAWDEAVSIAASGRLPLRSLVSHVIPAERFRDGIDMMRSRREDVLKVVIRWDSTEL